MNSAHTWDGILKQVNASSSLLFSSCVYDSAPSSGLHGNMQYVLDAYFSLEECGLFVHVNTLNETSTHEHRCITRLHGLALISNSPDLKKEKQEVYLQTKKRPAV